MATRALVVSALMVPVAMIGALAATPAFVSVSGQSAGTLAAGTVPAAYAGLVQRYGGLCPTLTPGRLAAQLYQENGFKRVGLSSAGAMGIAQFMPGTWAVQGVDGNGDGRADPNDPEDAIPTAARYDCTLARSLSAARVPGDPVNNMLAAYNAGPARIISAGGIPQIAETQHYVANIRQLEKSFTAVAAPVRPSHAAAIAIAFAQSKLGTPYLWGGTGTATQGGRFDCSGLAQAAWRTAGVGLPRVAADQWYAGVHVPRAELQPGDLVFFAWDISNPATIHHVGMYTGGGYMINAPYTGAVIRFDKMDKPDYIGAVRPSRATT